MRRQKENTKTYSCFYQQIILESEMDQATNAKGVHSTPYTKQHQEAHRSSSSMSNKSNFDVCKNDVLFQLEKFSFKNTA